MKKKIFALLLSLTLCLFAALPALAADLPRLVDDAGLLTAAQAASLEAELDEISQRQGFDVVIVTLDSLMGNGSEALAEWIWDEYHYGFGEEDDGIILLISMEERDWALTATGFGKEALNEDARAYMSDAFVPYLSRGDYDEAFRLFARMADELVGQARAGRPYKAPFNAGIAFLIAFLPSLAAALAVVSILKGQLRSVRPQAAAADYILPGSLQITQARERYLYRTVTRRERPKPSSGGHSGGGRHSSSSGKF